MFKVEKARRLFLENLQKKQNGLMTYIVMVYDLIEKEASNGEPGISINKNTFENYEPLSDETMSYIAAHFKANGYNVLIKAKFLSIDNKDLTIEEIFISWIDVVSMFDQDYIKNQLKNYGKSY